MEALETETPQGHQTHKKSVAGPVAGAVFCLLASAGIILGYFLFINKLDRQIESISKVRATSIESMVCCYFLCVDVH